MNNKYNNRNRYNKYKKNKMMICGILLRIIIMITILKRNRITKWNQNNNNSNRNRQMICGISKKQKKINNSKNIQKINNKKMLKHSKYKKKVKKKKIICLILKIQK